MIMDAGVFVAAGTTAAQMFDGLARRKTVLADEKKRKSDWKDAEQAAYKQAAGSLIGDGDFRRAAGTLAVNLTNAKRNSTCVLDNLRIEEAKVVEERADVWEEREQQL